MKPRSDFAKHAALCLAVVAAVTGCPASASGRAGADAFIATQTAPAPATPRRERAVSGLPETNVEATLAIVGVTILDVVDGSLAPDNRAPAGLAPIAGGALGAVLYCAIAGDGKA